MIFNYIKITTISLFISCLAFSSFAREISPMTQAMLNSYSKILADNPNDYFTLYQRAMQYYLISEYDDAQNDLIKAISYTPAKDKDALLDEYSLMSDILIETKEYDKALEYTKKSLNISPMDIASNYRQGNIYLYLKQPENALRSFKQMSRINSRSQEAYFGMARAEISLNKSSEAEEHLKAALNANPTNYLTFCRIGELYHELGDDQKASINFISAISLTTDNKQRPLESLTKIAEHNFPAFQSAIKYAISKTKNSLPLHYLQANIAYNTGHYQEAHEGFKNVLNTKDGQIAEAYLTMAETCVALNRFPEAQSYANLAVIKKSEQKTLIGKAVIESMMGSTNTALISIAKAEKLDPKNYDFLIGAANCNILNDDFDDAKQLLIEADKLRPNNVTNLMSLAYLYATDPETTEKSQELYSYISTIETSSFKDKMLQSIALYLAGKLLDAEDLVRESSMAKDKLTADDLYWLAVYYAQTGNKQKAKESISNAINIGYQNYYNIHSNNFLNLNLAPIRPITIYTR